MIENKFDITEAGLLETSSSVLKYMPKIRKLVVGTILAVVALVAAVIAFGSNVPIPLVILMGGFVVFQVFGAIKKLPVRMAKELYRDLKQDAMNRANPNPERNEEESDEEYEEEYEDEEEEEKAPLIDAEPFSHICVNEGGILIVGLDDEGDLIVPFSRLVRTLGTKNFIIVLNDNLKAITFHREGFIQGSGDALIAMLKQHCPNMKFDKGL